MNFVIISVKRLASKRKINYNSKTYDESMIESDGECNTELDSNISNILSSKKTKGSVSGGKNNNTKRKRSKFK